MSESSFESPFEAFKAFDLPDDAKSPSAILIGATSPLWGYFMGAAATGMAWWWMTRWAEPANLEAMFGAAERAGAEAFESLDELPQPDVEQAGETVIQFAEQAAEPVVALVEETVEAAPSVAEAIVAPDLPPEPVGGEGAPISPLVAANEEEPETPKPADA